MLDGTHDVALEVDSPSYETICSYSGQLPKPATQLQ